MSTQPNASNLILKPSLARTIQLLDEYEVSRRLSVSVNTLRYWRASGNGPNYVKLGRLVRYDAAALEKFILRNLRVSKARATMEEKRVAL